MYPEWNVHEAKNGFCYLVDEAAADRPQVVLRRGKPVAVIVSYAQFMDKEEPQESFVEFFRKSPLVGSGIDLSRDSDTGRSLAL